MTKYYPGSWKGQSPDFSFPICVVPGKSLGVSEYQLPRVLKVRVCHPWAFNSAHVVKETTCIKTCLPSAALKKQHCQCPRTSLMRHLKHPANSSSGLCPARPSRLGVGGRRNALPCLDAGCGDALPCLDAGCGDTPAFPPDPCLFLYAQGLGNWQ